MGETGVNILASFRLDDFRFLHVVRIKGKIFLRRLGCRGRPVFWLIFCPFSVLLRSSLARPVASVVRRKSTPAITGASPDCSGEQLLPPLGASAAASGGLPLGSVALVFGVSEAGIFSRCLIFRIFCHVSSLGLNLTCFGVLVANDAYGLARTFAGPGVGRGALPADRQSAAMPDAAITIDRL